MGGPAKVPVGWGSQSLTSVPSAPRPRARGLPPWEAPAQGRAALGGVRSLDVASVFPAYVHVSSEHDPGKLWENARAFCVPWYGHCVESARGPVAKDTQPRP